ncbi:MAG: hypothetical protein GF335_03535 [Candidatus Moranbacteria bacterium]|nr:hypothetical protein [Candidatus Moranbacteria bacterium]
MKKTRNFIVRIIKRLSLLIVIFLVIRFILKLFVKDSDSSNPLINFCYNASEWLLKPLPASLNLIKPHDGTILETRTLFAMLFYIIVTLLLIKIIYSIFKPLISFDKQLKQKNRENKLQTEEKTIMFTDIKGFTGRTSKKSRLALKKFLEKHKRLMLPIFKEFKGEIIKTIGDAFLVTFKSPTDAALCGIAIQKKLRQNNWFFRKNKLQIRIAINNGEVNVIDKDIYGEPVNLAARVERITEANEVYITESAYFIMNKNEFKVEEVGDFKFKGIKDEIKIFKIATEKKNSIKP